MIIGIHDNSKLSTSLEEVLKYHDDKEESTEEGEEPEILSQSDNDDKMKDKFKLSKLQSSSEQPFLHVFISLDPKDRFVSNKEFLTLAKDIMEKQLNIPLNDHIIHRHYDRGHQHIHIFTNKPTSNKFYKRKGLIDVVTRDMELKYNLVPNQQKNKYLVNEQRKELIKELRDVFDSKTGLIRKMRIQTVTQLKIQLKRKNISMEYNPDENKFYFFPLYFDGKNKKKYTVTRQYVDLDTGEIIVKKERIPIRISIDDIPNVKEKIAKLSDNERKKKEEGKTKPKSILKKNNKNKGKNQ